MNKKNIIAICAVLVILGMAIVLVLTGNRGNVSNVNRVVGYSALYGENSINEAFDVIEKKFADGGFNPNDTYSNWQWH